MSNYLNNLVAKSLNQTEVVQPRLASLFEPLPMSPGSVAGQDFNLEQLIGTATSDETEFKAQLGEPTSIVPPIELHREGRSRTPDLRSPPIPYQPLSVPFPTEETSLTPPPYQPSSAPVQTIMTPPSVRGEQLPSRSASLEPFPANRETTDATQPRNAAEQPSLPVFEPAVIQQGVTELVVSSKEPSPTAALPPELSFLQTTNPVAPKVIALPSQPLVPDPAESTVILGSTPTPRSATAAVVVKPQLISSVKSSAPNFIEGIETLQPLPTIQVTIGRIEVRATPPPTPSPAKARPPLPAMSLDEYLRQRGGGK